jgi:transposase
MALRKRQFSRDFKVQIVREVESGKSVAQVARENQVHPITISRWVKEQTQYAEKAFSGNGQMYKHEARIAELERMVGQLTMENAFLKKALLRLEGQADNGKDTGRN